MTRHSSPLHPFGPPTAGHGDPPTPPQKIRTNILLFLVTVVTTILAGAVNSGTTRASSSWGNVILSGIPYSVALLGILLAHEMGHYLTSRYHGVPASLPYFIPLPPPFLAGTLGAIIRMRGVIRDRRVLFDIGIAGPLAGFVVAVPATLIGLHHSEVINVGSTVGGIELGDSLLFMALIKGVFGSLREDQTVLLNPVAFAGWLGFFITSLNLLPMGQLDGGHVSYGIFGPRHRAVSRTIFLALVFWGVHGAFAGNNPMAWLWAFGFSATVVCAALRRNASPVWRYSAAFLAIIGIVGSIATVWVVWVVLMCFLRLDHPPTRDVSVPLDPRRRILGWIALILFILTFIPEPLRVVAP